jgi:adenylate cyclase
VTKAGELVGTLAAVLPIRGVVKKRREVFMVGRTRVHLDQVEGLGDFLELEVVLAPEEPVEEGMAEAKGLLRILGIEEEMLVPGAYVDLLYGSQPQEPAGSPPGPGASHSPRGPTS